VEVAGGDQFVSGAGVGRAGADEVIVRATGADPERPFRSVLGVVVDPALQRGWTRDRLTVEHLHEGAGSRVNRSDEEVLTCAALHRGGGLIEAGIGPRWEGREQREKRRQEETFEIVGHNGSVCKSRANLKGGFK
jgi:hypothetical protein